MAIYYIYDICYHLSDYHEEHEVRFGNPIHKGDYISDGEGEIEYLVFAVVHLKISGKSVLHVKYQNDEST